MKKVTVFIMALLFMSIVACEHKTYEEQGKEEAEKYLKG